ncbi:translocation/assembly module TamB domain-containing protein [Dokdonia sp. LLG6352-1]|uniref:translocation/assembly module TamB domain-containing protein n=1 Tax=Dokdonia sp. LLG6352-1 TaxID=3160831 RepID=UPI0038698402
MTNPENKEPLTQKPKRKFRWLRIIARILLALLILIIFLLLFIRSEWGQNIVVSKAVSYFSEKTQTKVELERAFVTFDGDIAIQGLYLEDKQGDTLVYSRSLEADIPLWPIINGTGIGIENAQWEGVRANIIRKDTLSGFNFDFIAAAFATPPSQQTDTTSTAPMDLIIGDLDLKDFDVVYNDAVTGIDSRYTFKELRISPDTVNLDEMRFTATEGYIENAQIKINQVPVPSDPDAEEIPLPYLAFNKLTLKDVSGNYTGEEAGVSFDFDFKELETSIPKADFNSFVIAINDIVINDSAIGIDMSSTIASQVPVESSNSLFPDYNITVDKASVINTNIRYTVNGAAATKGVFNPEAVFLSNVNLESTNTYLKDFVAGGNVKSLSGREVSGINVKSVSTNFLVSDTDLQLENMNAAINSNSLRGDIVMSYPSLDKIVTQPEDVRLDLNITDVKVALGDLFLFQPSLRTNTNLQTVSKNRIAGAIKASGTLADLTIPNLALSWSNTDLKANGNLKNINDIDNLYFNLPNINASTSKNDISKFIATDSLSINLPQDIKIVAAAKGTLTDITTTARLTTTQGLATIDGTFKNNNTIAFNTTLAVEEYNLGELLQNNSLGNLNLTLKGQGSGTSLNTLDANVEATVASFLYNDYAIKDLTITSKIKDGEGAITSSYKDSNLNTKLTGLVVLDTIAPAATINLDVIGVDLQALGLMQRDVRTGFKLTSTFKGSTASYDVTAVMDDGVIVYDDRTYLIGNLEGSARVRPDSTSVQFDNKILNLDLRSNADPARIATALQNHVNSYFYRDAIIKDTITNPVNVVLKGKVRQSPLLNEVFLVNMKDLDTIAVDLDFSEATRKLDASIKAPHINYAGNELDSLSFNMNTDRDAFTFDLGFDGLTAGPIAIQETRIKGNQTNNELSLDFLAYANDEKLIQVQSDITGSKERLRFHVSEDSLIFNKKDWKTTSSNEVLITDGKLAFNDFRFTRKLQSVEFTDKLPTIEKDHIGIDFQNFKISEFLAYLNPDEKLASGNLNGDFVVEEPFGDFGFLADIYVEQLRVLGEDLGILELAGRSIKGNKYDFNLAVSEGVADLELTGDYIADIDGATINMDLDINELKMEALDGFSLGELKDGSGTLNGNFKMNGKLVDLEYQGFLRFNEAGFTVTKLNAPFTLLKETVSIDNEGISMSNFTIRDAKENKLTVDGLVGTERFINPTFDLKVVANDFQALNAEKGDNDFVYGTAVFDATASITGDLQIPVIDLDATVGGSTDITYIMPTAAANIESSEGIVVFVNRQNPDAILTRTEEETGTITGFDIKSLLKVNRDAQVTILIDEETGDNLKVNGDADLNFTLQPNGRMNLTGVYDVAGGQYEMNLYNLVNRTFTLDPSSRVSWSGDPFDAKLDVRAVYSVDASAAPLMAITSTSDDPAAQSQYRQQLPFLVYLNVDGELLSPEINFALDLPEDEQGALGGEVYSRVQQVNQQTGELNRQVFSLLVLNRFYPDSNSDGSQGGFASIARDNLNDALSDQLNIFSDKLLGNTGFQLDFGLDTFTDYQGTTPQERTQLDIAAQRKFFNDKLTVRVGSSVDVAGESANGDATPLIGNVSLEYELTEDGQYRLKGFRRSEFENVIDGQTIVSGISLIFQQEFNKFSQLWDAILRKKQQQLIEEEKEKEALEPSPENRKTNKID